MPLSVGGAGRTPGSADSYSAPRSFSVSFVVCAGVVGLHAMADVGPHAYSSMIPESDVRELIAYLKSISPVSVK